MYYFNFLFYYQAKDGIIGIENVIFACNCVMWCVIGYVHVLFRENRFAKLSVVDKILRAVASTICRPKYNFSDLSPPPPPPPNIQVRNTISNLHGNVLFKSAYFK